MNAWSQCLASVPKGGQAWVWRRHDLSGGRRWLYRRRGACRFALAAWLILPGWLGCLGQSATTYQEHADQALQSFLLKFWKASAQYLQNSYPSDSTLTSYWTYAHGWDALMDGVERTGGQQYSGLIESFYEGQNARGWANGFYDDECWMTMALTRAYDLTGAPQYLTQATNLYADIMTGWDTTCCGATPGGLWWDKAHTQKATAANAGAALAGARLYRRTGNAAYLSFAQQVYSYWNANMVNLATFQVCDHLNPDGSKTWWRFTYNEGLMIGASVELNEATGNPSYLAVAHNIAGFMVNNEVTATAYGLVLYDGSNTGCNGDCHEFKGPAYRYLMRLYAKDTTKTQYYTVLKASADALWNLALDSTSTVFSVNWAGPSQSSVAQSQDNAACIALNRFAQQYGPYPGSGLPANQYEAENATLHNVALEALYGAFTGWGYIAAWNTDGQSVDFNINCTTAGPHTLAFRYAAGTGNASRLIAINGVNAFRNQDFPGTGAWDSYRTNTVSWSLPAGPSTISVIYKSSRGSANYLNLDNLVVGGDTSTALASSANPSTYGNSITFTATVTSSGGVPTGTVTFHDGGASLGTGTLGSGSGNTATATLALANLTATTHSITAMYGGDNNFNLSTSSALSQGVTAKALTVTGITANNKVYDGNTTATLNPASAALAGKAGADDVTLNPAGATGAFTDADAGTGKTVTISDLSLTGGDAGNYSLTAPTATADITGAGTTTALVSSENPSGPGSNVTFTATVSSGAGTSAGEVVFLANSVPFSTNTLVSGVATASTTALPLGRNAVAAQYAAQGNYLGSSDNLDQVVKVLVTCSRINAIVGIADNLDGTFTITFVGTPQAQYYVVTSADVAASMSSWAPLAGSTNTVTNTSGQWQITVTNTAPQQYYRSTTVVPCP